MYKEVVLKELPENFDTALESKQTGVTDNWRVKFGKNFVKRGEGFSCEFELEVQIYH